MSIASEASFGEDSLFFPILQASQEVDYEENAQA
jgi:hypothetical protein